MTNQKKFPANVDKARPVTMPPPKVRLKVKVCLPTYNGLEPDTLTSVQNLDQLTGYEFTCVETRHALTIEARNMLSSDAENYDYLLWVDSDMGFTITNIQKMFNANKDIVGAAYQHKNTSLMVGSENYNMNTNQGLVKAPWVGFGLVLEKTHIYECMTKPYFACPPEIDGNGVVSEDIFHCTRALDKRWEVWLDTNNKVRHLDAKGLLNVKLTNEQWAEVIKAMAQHPMPYVLAEPLIKSLTAQLRTK